MPQLSCCRLQDPIPLLHAEPGVVGLHAKEVDVYEGRTLSLLPDAADLPRGFSIKGRQVRKTGKGIEEQLTPGIGLYAVDRLVPPGCGIHPDNQILSFSCTKELVSAAVHSGNPLQSVGILPSKKPLGDGLSHTEIPGGFQEAFHARIAVAKLPTVLRDSQKRKVALVQEALQRLLTGFSRLYLCPCRCCQVGVFHDQDLLAVIEDMVMPYGMDQGAA